MASPTSGDRCQHLIPAASGGQLRERPTFDGHRGAEGHYVEPGKCTNDHSRGHAAPVVGRGRNVARSHGVERLASAHMQAHVEGSVLSQNTETQPMVGPV